MGEAFQIISTGLRMKWKGLNLSQFLDPPPFTTCFRLTIINKILRQKTWKCLQIEGLAQ